MKIIITENKLYNIFEKYMDSYNLSFDENEREFIDKKGNRFGWMAQVIFRTKQSTKDSLSAMFGDNVYRMLKTYLINRFPEVDIVYMD